MLPENRVASILALLVLCALLSCSGGGGNSLSGIDTVPLLEAVPAPLEAVSGLPAPSALPRYSSSLPADNLRVLDGTDCEAAPRQNLDLPAADRPPFGWRTGPAQRYNPTGSQNNTLKLSATAFGLYSFPGFYNALGKLQVNVDWVDQPAAGSCYVGLANVQSDRWDWYQLPTSEHFEIAQCERYISASAEGCVIRLVVMLLGSSSHQLDSVVLGEPVAYIGPLETDLDYDFTKNVAPRTVKYVAAVSIAGADITGFDFDLDGQPGYEVLNDADGRAEFTYTQPGGYNIGFRYHDDRGHTQSPKFYVVIVDPNNQPPVASVTASSTSGDAPLTVTLDASASFDPDGTITDYEWDVDADGQTDFETSGPTLEYTFGSVGQLYFSVRVTDNNFATDAAANHVDVATGWHITPIDTGGFVDAVSVASSGSAPFEAACVAWHSTDTASNTDSLKFCRATAVNGSSWGQVQTLASGGLENGVEPALCVDANGALRLFYGARPDNSAPGSLCLLRSVDSAGSGWYSGQVLSYAGYGGHNAAALVDGRPAVLSAQFAGAPGHSLSYFRAANTDASQWNSEQVVDVAGSGNFKGLAMTATGAGPLVSYSHEVPAGSGDMTLSFADDTDGTVWHHVALWNQKVLNSSALLELANGDMLALSSAETPFSTVNYSVSSSWQSAWPSPQPMDSQVNLGGQLDGAMLGGRPALCFHDQGRGDLYFRRGASDGLSWDTPVAVWTAGSTGDECRLTVVAGRPLICFYDPASSTLFAAWYDGNL